MLVKSDETPVYVYIQSATLYQLCCGELPMTYETTRDRPAGCGGTVGGISAMMALNDAMRVTCRVTCTSRQHPQHRPRAQQEMCSLNKKIPRYYDRDIRYE